MPTHERQQRAVDQERAQPLGAVHGPRGAPQRRAARVDAAHAGGHRAHVPHPRGRHAQHHRAGPVRPPAEVDVLAQQGNPGVEPAEPLPQLAADQHAGRRHREHLGALPEPVPATQPAPVQFGRSDAGLPVPGRVGGQAGLDHEPRVGPSRVRAGRARRPTGDASAADSSVARQSGSGAQSSCSTQIQPPGSPQRSMAADTASWTAAAKPVRRSRVSTPSSTRSSPRAASLSSRGVSSSEPVSTASTCLGRGADARSVASASGNHASPSWHTSTASTGAVRSTGVLPRGPYRAMGTTCHERHPRGVTHARSYFGS